MLKHFKRFLSSLLIAVMMTVWLGVTSPQPAFASINIDILSIPKKVKQVFPGKKFLTNIDILSIPKKVKQVLPNKELLTNIDLSIPKKVKQVLPSKEFLTNIDILSIPKKVKQILPEKQILPNKEFIGRNAKRFLSLGPAIVCQAYYNDILNINDSTWDVIEEGLSSSATISGAIASASAAGAGNLAGYAGMASAVSQLGLGELTTAIAGMMGSSATGAAATAVVTSAIGGPVVMGTVIVGGTAIATYGTYELGKFAVKSIGNKLSLGELAKSYCSSK